MIAYTYTDYQHAADVIRNKTPHTPQVGLVLGSGLGGLVNEIQDATIIPYEEIPGWPVSTVVGHQGNLVIGKLGNKIVAAQQGRAHFYEGYSAQQVVFPIRVMKALGIRTVVLTNAAGGLNPNYLAGDIMVINDHINLIGIAGFSALIGPNDDALGPRFPGMGQNYTLSLRKLAHSVAADKGFTLREGVYVGLSGPQFETPAEVRMLRMWGADAVGMSTVNEVVAARHMGMEVLALSSITNKAVDMLDAEEEANHLEVLEVGRTIVPRLTAVVQGVLEAL
ncbi:MAG: purine-nucleoside phosphorylase [Phototrophicaceae bacterium]|jgi:purine-nucleoside phosphorylase